MKFLSVGYEVSIRDAGTAAPCAASGSGSATAIGWPKVQTACGHSHSVWCPGYCANLPAPVSGPSAGSIPSWKVEPRLALGRCRFADSGLEVWMKLAAPAEANGEPHGDGAASLFSLRQVSQERGGAVILRELTLDLPRTAITALVGPSGAGKTSLLRLLNRMDDPTAGEVAFAGRPIRSYPVGALRRRVGFVFQAPAMFPGHCRGQPAHGGRVGRCRRGGGGAADRRRPRRRGVVGRLHAPRGRPPLGRRAAAGEHRAGPDDPAGSASSNT